MNKQAMQKAKEIYTEMKELYLAGNENPEAYISIAQKYAVLVCKGGSYKYGIYTEWTIKGTPFISDNGKSVYTSCKSFTNSYDFLMFTEDCAMMVYRLHGGQGYNTMELAVILASREDT